MKILKSAVDGGLKEAGIALDEEPNDITSKGGSGGGLSKFLTF